MRQLGSARVVVVAAILTGATLGCRTEPPPAGSYYEDRIAPIFEASCARTTAGCHLADDRGTAAGNLDLSSYDALRRRTDALVPYGPYPRPLLLMKVTAPVEIAVETTDGTVTIETDVRHAGDATLDVGSRAFNELSRWLTSGYARTGAPAVDDAQNDGDCVPGAGRADGFDPDAEPADRALFDRFVTEVQPTLVARCAGSGCHGAALADFHLACGETEAERRWNFFIALMHLSDPPERSELLARPLAVARGGTFHGGGDTFAEPEDDGHRALEGWAQAVVRDAPALVRDADPSEGYRFFVDRVQPALVRKGCMMLNCHSPISAVFNLRGGSGGAFSRFARRRNYEAARALLALESPDAAQSRIIAKNLFPPEMTSGGRGVAHRGGSLFEDFADGPASVAACASHDADAGDLNEVPALCVLARWHGIERAEGIARGELDPDAQPVRAVAWITRPRDLDAPGEFDVYAPGAELWIAEVTVDGARIVLGASRSVMSECGLDAARADVRGPASSWDGTELAFAARSAEAEPLRLWRVSADGTGCAPIEGVAPDRDVADGILLHDFDPAFAPDGRIVFASTRGTSWGRPTRTPAALAPNADLYVLEGDGAVRQLTFLLNQELAPAFMQDGRVIYTAEKRELDFHMLALRRQNLDGGDYHPLYASRRSLGFGAATDVQQLPNGNFAFVAAPLGAGAGSLAVFNRTIGPDQTDRDPGERGYLHSLTVPGRGLHHGGAGLFRSVATLPTGRVLTACADDEGAPFAMCELDPGTGDRRVVHADPTATIAEVAALYARPDRGVLVSDGEGIDRPEVIAGATDAEVHFNDFPMIQSLMFTNTRTGRPIDPRIGGFDVLTHRPPPAGISSFAELDDVVDDAYGRFYRRADTLGWVPLFADGSARMRVPGGVPLSFAVTDLEGAPLDMMEGMPMSGPAVQREHEQYYPGERIQRSIPRRFFNGVCGSCHGSITGRELDVTVSLDVISGASVNTARDAAPVDLVP